jgi:hypothetical protein
MQKVLFFLFFLCTTIIAKAQLVYPYSDIKLEKPGDYIATEPMALSAASFLLTTPFAANNQDRISALKFMVNWMQGDKKYDFYLKGMVADIREDNDLAGLFLAAMVSYTLKNKTAAVNPITVDLNAAKIIIAYCDDPKNNFKLKKKYRKMLEKN